jgi:hypothetical protein
MIILRQKQYSKIGELRNKVIRDKAARMIKTANKKLHDAKDSIIRESTAKINKALTSNNPESKKNERLEMLWKTRKKKLDNIESHKNKIGKNISEIQEKFPKGLSISKDDFKSGKSILDRFGRENTYYQKSYSWSEFGKAAKSIGIGALLGAGGGLAMGGRKYEKTGNFDKKGGLIKAGVGAGLGALAGAGIYRAGHKERLKAKEKLSEFENKYGITPEEYFTANLPKGYKEVVDKVCKDIENLNNTFRRSKEADLMYLNENYLCLNSINYSNASEVAGYITDDTQIPLASLACICFDTIPYSGNINYNIKTKKFSLNQNTFTKLKDLLLDNLEFLLDFVKEDIEGIDESEDTETCSKEFIVWKKEYYEKAKNIIKQMRI